MAAPSGAGLGTRVRDALPGAVSFLAPLGTYLLTLRPGIGFGDTAKFQFAAALGGTPHATGYPVYLMLGGLLDRLLPFGAPSFDANLLSALCAAGAAACLFAGLRRLRIRTAIALAGALAFALGRALWSQAVEAEVYTLNVFLLAAVMALLLRWRETDEDRALWAALLLYGLSFGNHVTTVCTAPAVALLVLERAPQILRRARFWIAVAASLALAVIPYAWIVWRSFAPDTPYLETGGHTLGELLYNLGGAQHRWNLLRLSGEAMLRDRLPWVGREISAQYGWFTLAVPLAFGQLPRRVLLALLAVIAGSVLFVILYSVPDLFVYLIPVHLAVAVLVASGVERLAAGAASNLRALVLLLPWALALLLATGNRAAVDRRRERVDEHVAELLAAAPAPSGILSFDYDLSMALEYGALFAPAGHGTPIVFHLPPPTLRVKPGMERFRRFLAGEAPLRWGPRDRLLAVGAPLLCACGATDREALLRLGFTLSSQSGDLVPLGVASDGPIPLPLAWMVHRLEAVGSLPAAIERLAEPSFDLRRSALVIAGGAATLDAGGSTGAADRVQWGTYGEREISLTVDAAQPGWLVLGDRLSAPWAIELDGGPAETAVVDVLYLGVAIPAGRHQLRLVRDDRPFSLRRFLASQPAYLVPLAGKGFLVPFRR